MGSSFIDTTARAEQGRSCEVLPEKKLRKRSRQIWC